MSRDLRKYAHQTNFRLIIGGLIVLFFFGVGLIFMFYGAAAAVSGAICFVIGLSPLLIIGVVLYLIDWLVNKSGN